MIKYDVGVVGEMMLTKLKAEVKMTHTQFYRMRTVGLGTIKRHFKKIGNTMVSRQILRDFLEAYHAEHCTDNDKIIQRWRAVRRAAELLIYFSETGRVDLPILPDWTKRNCSLRIRPTAEQMADKDNIYSLIWRTRSADAQLKYEGREEGLELSAQIYIALKENMPILTIAERFGVTVQQIEKLKEVLFTV